MRLRRSGSTRDKRTYRGIGLYTAEQVRNTTPFQYFGGIVVGVVVCATGGLLLCRVVTIRQMEIRDYGVAQPHVGAWIGSVAVVLIGIFMAHAGVIYYARRLLHKAVGSSRKRRHSNGSQRHGQH